MNRAPLPFPPRSAKVAEVRAQAPATPDARNPDAVLVDALTHELGEMKARMATLEATVRRFTSRVLDMEARETV